MNSENHPTLTGRDNDRLLPFCLISLGLHLIALAFFAWFGGGRATPPPAKVIEVQLEAVIRRDAAERVAQPDRPKPVARTRPPARSVTNSPRVAAPRQRPERRPPAPPAVGAPAPAASPAASTADPASTTQSTRHEPQVDAPAVHRPHQRGMPAVAAADPAGASAAEGRYTTLIRALIERRKEYPPQARKAGQTGTTQVSFVLAKNGELLETRVAVSCGRSLLDRAAVRAVESVGRFPPFPDQAWGDSRVFQVPICFRLE